MGQTVNLIQALTQQPTANSQQPIAKNIFTTPLGDNKKSVFLPPKILVQIIN